MGFLHAVAIYLAVAQAAGGRQPDLQAVETRLHEAERLLGRTLEDPELQQEGTALVEVVRTARMQIARIRKVEDCIRTFNRTVEHYQRSPIRDREQLRRAQIHFTRMREDVARLRQTMSEHPADQQTLTALEREINSTLRMLSRPH